MHSRERRAMQKAVRKEKMKVIERPVSLRDMLEKLKAEGDLIESDKPVDPDLELTGLQKHLDGACPMLFNKVKGKPNHRLVTNLFGDMNVINKMFGWTDDTDRTRKLAYALSHPIKPQEVMQSVAPCQEVVIENPKDVNDYYKSDEPVPITMCFGVPPACTLLAGAAFGYAIMPQGCDEIGIAGAVQGAPIRLVKARTVDAMALADAEIVLEGYVNPRDRRFETKEAEDSGVQGRHHFHPEWAGYMGKSYKAPTFHVTAVTMRQPASKPIVFALGVHMLDDHNIDTTVREATIFELCNRLQPGIIQDVVIPYSMTDWGGCIIQVRKRHQIDEGWQRNFLGAILSCSQGMRLAIAVSEDVDPYSMDDVMWCMTTRVNPRTDILNPIPGGRGQTFMPAER